jgi:biuret amidohydrolase
MTLDISTTALVITDPQLDVLAADGKLADLLHPQVEKRGVVAHLRQLRDHAERLGVPVVYSTLEHGAKTVAAPPTNAPVYAMITDRGAMRPGAGGDIHPQLVPTDKTALATPRTGMMAFGVTDIDQLLRARGAKTLVMAGMVLNLCLESNVRAAVDHGYEVVVVSDATATISDEAHEATLASLGFIAQRILTTEEVLAELTQAAAA